MWTGVVMGGGCGDGRWVWTVSGVEMGRRGGCGLWVVW